SDKDQGHPERLMRNVLAEEHVIEFDDSGGKGGVGSVDGAPQGLSYRVDGDETFTGGLE
ncbi:hypothetical protein E4U45_000454, partial [Claviceps purpurea]